MRISGEGGCVPVLGEGEGGAFGEDVGGVEVGPGGELEIG
jgi:hypothetical protein